MDQEDYLRFIHDLFEFNDIAAAMNIYYRKPYIQSYEVQPRKIEYKNKKREREKRKLIIEILAFCLMPNHFHLIVRQIKDNGIVKFMQKLGTGYTMYFNEKQKRVGSLFQGRFKAVLINQEPHFIHLPYYIHLNPLDLITPEWRSGEIQNLFKAIKFLESYRWSSYLDYAGKKNFPSVTNREFFLKFFDGTANYKKSIIAWLKNLDINEIKEITLE